MRMRLDDLCVRGGLVTIAEEIERYTAEHSNFDVRRDYISLSHIHQTVEEIVDQYRNGFQDGRDVRLRCYKGYQMEKDLLVRIRAVYGPRIKGGGEISIFDGLVKGHPDFLFDDYPGDCKSVLMDEWLPIDGKLPRRIFWQMQAYMKFAEKQKALVIFESRESGKLVDIWLRPSFKVQNEIVDKLEEIREKICSV